MGGKMSSNGRGGVRPGSGRKPAFREVQIEEVLKRSIRDVLLYMDDPEINKTDKFKMACMFAAKTVPERLIVEAKKALTFEERMQLADKAKEMFAAMHGRSKEAQSNVLEVHKGSDDEATEGDQDQ